VNSPHLTDLSPTVLAAAIQSNLYDYFHWLGGSPKTDFYHTPILYRWHTGIPHPWFNGVHTPYPPDSSADRVIRDTLGYFRSNYVDAITWWLGPDPSARAWENWLIAHGLVEDRHTPGMALDLSRLRPPERVPPGLTIHPVETQTQLRDWVRAFIAGYELPPALETPYYDLIAPLGLDTPVRYYAGYWNGQIVATSTVFMGSGVAGLYNDSTLPAARGQGLGAALTLAPLRWAAQQGVRAAILQSSFMGYGLYRRLGFEKLCDMTYYYWSLQ